MKTKDEETIACQQYPGGDWTLTTYAKRSGVPTLASIATFKSLDELLVYCDINGMSSDYVEIIYQRSKYFHGQNAATNTLLGTHA